MAATGGPGARTHPIDFFQLSLSLRWETVLLPFEQLKFLSLLPGEGYILADEVLRRPPGTRVSGGLARKGDAVLNMDADKPSMAVHCPQPEKLLAELEGLEELLRSKLGFDSAANALFYELVSAALVQTDRSPMNTLRSLHLAESVGKPLSDVLGVDSAAPISFRFGPPEGDPNSKEWWDVLIEPSFRSPHQFWRITVVFRSADRARVLRLAGDVESVTERMLRVLEGQSG